MVVTMLSSCCGKDFKFLTKAKSIIHVLTNRTLEYAIDLLFGECWGVTN